MDFLFCPYLHIDYYCSLINHSVFRGLKTSCFLSHSYHGQKSGGSLVEAYVSASPTRYQPGLRQCRGLLGRIYFQGHPCCCQQDLIHSSLWMEDLSSLLAFWLKTIFNSLLREYLHRAAHNMATYFISVCKGEEPGRE